jgi:hypothetical protein
MIDRLRAFSKGRRRRQLVLGLAVTAAAMLSVALPMGLRLRRSLRELERVKATYARKLEWAQQKGALEKRVREQQAAVAEVDSRLLTEASLPKFTQFIAVAARAAGCRVASIRPLEQRLLPRPGEKGKREATRGAKKEARRAQFVQLPVRVALLGEYEQLCRLLGRLGTGRWYLRVTRLVLQPEGEDRTRVSCDLQVAGHALRTPPQEK